MTRRQAGLWLAWLLIAALVLLAWSNSLHGEFTYDDKIEVIGNRTIRFLDKWRLVLAYNWSRPLTVASYALNYHFAGRDPFTWHLVDTALHALNAGLALLLAVSIAEARSLKQPLLVGALAAGLWALHPLTTESVSYVAGRSEQLCGSFYLAGCWLYLRHAREGDWRSWLGAWLCAALGFFTKEVAVTMPAAFLLLELAIVRGGDWRRVRWTWQLPGLLALAAFFGLRWKVYGAFTSPIDPLRPLDVQLFTEAEVLLRYLQLSLLPVGLSVFHDHPQTGATLRSVAAMAVVLGAGLGALAGLRRRPLLAFSVLWFLLLLAPSSSFVTLKETMAEHRVYLSLLGVTLPIAAALAGLERRGLALGAALVLLLGGLTYSRNRVWATEVAHWEDAAAKNPDSAEAWYGLGDALYLAQRHGDSQLAYARAVEEDPGYLDAWNNLGRAHALLGQVEEARTAWKSALKVSPSYCTAHNNLGKLAGEQGELREAEQWLNTALAYCPKNCRAHRLLGELYGFHLDERQLAQRHFEVFLDICDDDAQAPEVREMMMQLTW